MKNNTNTGFVLKHNIHRMFNLSTLTLVGCRRSSLRIKTTADYLANTSTIQVNLLPPVVSGRQLNFTDFCIFEILFILGCNGISLLPFQVNYGAYHQFEKVTSSIF